MTANMTKPLNNKKLPDTRGFTQADMDRMLEVAESLPPVVVKIRAGYRALEAVVALGATVSRATPHEEVPVGPPAFPVGIPIMQDDDLGPHVMEVDYSDGTTETILPIGNGEVAIVPRRAFITDDQTP